MLLDHGADVDKDTTDTGVTPIYLAGVLRVSEEYGGAVVEFGLLLVRQTRELGWV